DFAWETDLWRTYGILDRHPWSLMVNRLSDPKELESAMVAAGFANVRVRSEFDDRLHADAAEWWEKAFYLPMAKAAIESLGREGMERFRQDAFAKLQALARPGGIPQRVEALFGLGRNP